MSRVTVLPFMCSFPEAPIGKSANLFIAQDIHISVTHPAGSCDTRNPLCASVFFGIVI